MINGYNDLLAFGKENFDAVVKSGTLAAKGIEELSKVYASYTGQSIEKANAVVKALSSAKTPQEFLSLQNQVARESIEQIVVDSRKFAELFSSVLHTSFEPLTARFAAFQSLAKSAA